MTLTIEYNLSVFSVDYKMDNKSSWLTLLLGLYAIHTAITEPGSCPDIQGKKYFDCGELDSQLSDRCIAVDLKCNHKVDCYNGADEFPTLCGKINSIQNKIS